MFNDNFGLFNKGSQKSLISADEQESMLDLMEKYKESLKLIRTAIDEYEKLKLMWQNDYKEQEKKYKEYLNDPKSDLQATSFFGVLKSCQSLVQRLDGTYLNLLEQELMFSKSVNLLEKSYDIINRPDRIDDDDISDLS